MPDHPTSPVANAAKFLTVFGTVFHIISMNMLSII